MTAPHFHAVPLTSGLHLIGMDDGTQGRFHQSYNRASASVKQGSFESLYMTGLMSGFEEVASADVGGIITTLVMDREGYRFQNYAWSPDQGANWIAVTAQESGAQRFVNGKPFGVTTPNYEHLMAQRYKRFDV